MWELELARDRDDLVKGSQRDGDVGVRVSSLGSARPVLRRFDADLLDKVAFLTCVRGQLGHAATPIRSGT